jgi:hypothetical protein
MNIDGAYTYNLKIKGDVYRAIESIVVDNLSVSFHKSLTIKDISKLYIIHHNNHIYYVGYAGQPITARLRYGLNPRSTKGYAGYKWKHQEEVSITIFTFSSINIVITDSDRRLFVEAVEAEVVYGIRNRTGRWPEYQNEIHFNNNNTAEVRICAKKILDKILIMA